MKLKGRAVKIISKSELGAKMVEDTIYRKVSFAVFGLIFNLLYAFYNCSLGIMQSSIWFASSGIYYLLLAVIRFSAVIGHKKDSPQKEISAMRISGITLLALSAVMALIIYISLIEDTAIKHGEIIMITIATYTFTKITLAIISLCKSKGRLSPTLYIISSVRYAEVAVSVFTMQKSMLVSFGEMPANKIFMLNIGTGSGVWLLLLFLSILLIINSGKEAQKWQNQN